MYNFCAAKLKGYIYIAIRLAVKKKGAEAFVFTKNIHYYFYHIFFLILISFITIFYHFTFFVGAAQRQNKATERADKLASCNFMIVYKLNAECRVESRLSLAGKS